MKHDLNTTEYRCTTYHSRFGTVIFVIFFLLAYLSLIGIALLTENVKNSNPTFITVIVILIGLFFIYLLYDTIVLTRKLSFCYLVINNHSVRLENKKGDCVVVERKLEQIKKIVVTDGSGGIIALVDDVGQFGKGLPFDSGDYIKLQYTKKKLQNIVKFLPDCPLEIRHTHKPDVWN